MSSPVSGRLPLLDGMRAVAVLLVIAAHLCRTPGFPVVGESRALLVQGAIGVDLFFVISGFLITTLLIQERNRTGRISIGRFFFRRGLRILPVYAVFLSVVAGLEWHGHFNLQTNDWLAAATYTTNFLRDASWQLGHLWSLSIEEHFYLVWPIAFVALNRRWIAAAPVFCIVTGLICRLVLLTFFPDDSWMSHRWTITRVDGISLGCLLAICVQSSRVQRRLNAICCRPGIPILAMAGCAGSLWLSTLSYSYRILLAFPVNALLLTILLWSSLLRSNTTCRWLDQRWLKAIGIRSYSIYLWQQIFLVADAPGLLGHWSINLVAAFVTAWLSYRFIESPALALKERFKSSRSSARHGPRKAGPNSHLGVQHVTGT